MCIMYIYITCVIWYMLHDITCVYIYIYVRYNMYSMYCIKSMKFTWYIHTQCKQPHHHHIIFCRHLWWGGHPLSSNGSSGSIPVTQSPGNGWKMAGNGWLRSRKMELWIYERWFSAQVSELPDSACFRDGKLRRWEPARSQRDLCPVNAMCLVSSFGNCIN